MFLLKHKTSPNAPFTKSSTTAAPDIIDSHLIYCRLSIMNPFLCLNIDCYLTDTLWVSFQQSEDHVEKDKFKVTYFIHLKGLRVNLGQAKFF